jgi:hypothetical protein
MAACTYLGLARCGYFMGDLYGLYLYSWRLKLSGLMEVNAVAGPEHEQCGDGI